MAVMLVTSVGEMVIDLFTDECPLATKNFLKLCKMKYYNECLFHNVQQNFIVQTGDPTGTGEGGDSVYKFLYGNQARFFDDEIRQGLTHAKLGTVAMASAGENCNASQFYITTRAELTDLDEKHTVFGQVAEGIEVLMRINEAIVDESGRPLKNIRIKHTYILEDPFDDPPQLADLIPGSSPHENRETLTDVRLEEDWQPMEEQLAPEEVDRKVREREAQGRAVVLEMVGDLPEADVKPPENVLFVCKLNPVTQEEDLEIIFSRFGKLVSCDIIRDYKTGDSLCYGFIEFENPDSCEAAYFKMDNVLIDDRRIHVDFSQSVGKLWNQFRRVGNKQNAEDNPDEDGKPKPKELVLKEQHQQHKTGGRYEMVFDDGGNKQEAGPPGRPERDHRNRGGRHQGRPREERGHDARLKDRHQSSDRETCHYDHRKRGSSGGRDESGHPREHERRDRRDVRQRDRSRERSRDRGGDSRRHREHGRDREEDCRRRSRP